MRKLIGPGITAAILALCSYSAYCAEPAGEAKEPANHETALQDPNHEAHEVTVKCIEPHAPCAESQKVIETLQTMVKAINNGDWKTYESYLDEHCSTFDENSKKLISGKENVMNDMKEKIAKYAKEGHPFVHVIIDHPYAKVIPPANDTAIVSLVAIREYGGKHPFREECKITDIFTKHDGVWKKSHFRGAWKKV